MTAFSRSDFSGFRKPSSCEEFSYEAAGRSHYHPEELLEFWERANSDASFRQDLTANGFRFDMKEKAINFTAGWVLIGDNLAGDFLEIEKTMNVELIFSNYPGRSSQPAFVAIKQQWATRWQIGS